MTEVFVARQPIFDHRLEVVGYELLFRSGAQAVALVKDAEVATANVVLTSFTELGLERIVGGRPAWINVSREFLLQGFVRSLPADRVVLEILEDQLIDDQLIAAVAALKHEGYRVALDDFRFTPSAEPLLALADIVKLDLLDLGAEGLRSEVARLRPHGVALVAEKLETREDFTIGADAGCDLFQGYFFCRPELVSGPAIDANRMSLLKLLAVLAQPGVELADLQQTIALDLRLTYRLLRYINSAFFGLRQEVRSIGQALALLGVERLRQWAALSVFASVESKPTELTLTALVRARFCELAGQREGDASAGELFTVGLFSLVDAVMDLPMSEIVSRIPFADDTRAALVDHAGARGRLIECAIALEQGRFENAEQMVPGAGDLYLEAVTWADEAAGTLFA